MAKYTIALKDIVKTIEIFDFDYPIFREEFRKEFEKQFIDYFLFEEIAHETVGQFKHRLKVKLNLIMPRYNKLYETQEMQIRILDTYDVKEVYSRETVGEAEGFSKNLYKDAPKTKINIDKIDVVNSITQDENKGTTKGSEKWERTMKGSIGIQTDAEAIVKYWKVLRNITLELFENELSELFLGVF